MLLLNYVVLHFVLYLFGVSEGLSGFVELFRLKSSSIYFDWEWEWESSLAFGVGLEELIIYSLFAFVLSYKHLSKYLKELMKIAYDMP